MVDTQVKSRTEWKGSDLRMTACVACPLGTINQVLPSGGDLATASAAMAPPAPARFSTTTGCPSALDSRGAMKRATIDKDAHVGDPKFVKVPVERLTSKAYAKGMADEIARGVKAEVPRFNSGAVSKDTTHISVLDKDGNCFTMTHSLGMPSGVVTPGLGFMYNGCMGVFDPRPGRAGSIAPGKARFSSVVPSIVFKDGKPHLIIGAPGATQIAMGVLHVILNALDFDMTMVEAVSAPRFSATSDTIDISNRIQFKVERELKGQGYPVVRSPYGFGFAAVHAIRIHGDGLDGGADPGHDGVVIAV